MSDESYTDEEMELMYGSASIVKGHFGTKRPELAERIKKRAVIERNNTRTKKELSRAANKKTKLINFRATPDFHGALGRWAEAADMSAGVLIEAAVRDYAKRKKLDKKGGEEK